MKVEKKRTVENTVGKPAVKVAEKPEEKKPLVSVIMPVYNAATTVVNSLYSIIDQSYENIEIICINDGSTDTSLEILTTIRDNCKQRKIKVIDQKNAGPAAARNAGLDNATGEYIAFVDSDDYIESNAYQRLVEIALAENPDIIVYGGSTFPREVPTPEWMNTKLSTPSYVYAGENAGQTALLREESSKPFIWQHFIKRQLFETKPKLRFNTDFEIGEDQLIIFSYFPRAKKVCYIGDRFYHYRISERDSIMHKYYNRKSTKFRAHVNLVRNVAKHWHENNIVDYTGEMMAYFVNFLYDDLRSFPEWMQIKFAKEIVVGFQENGFGAFLCREEGRKKLEEILRLAERDEIDLQEEIERRQYAIDRAQRQIQSILDSKAYKIGRYFTKKSQRIDEKWLLNQQKEKIF